MNSLSRVLLSITLVLSVCAPVAPAVAEWSSKMQGGGAVTVNPDTRRATVTKDGVSSQLWDGAHRMEDGSVLIVNHGEVVGIIGRNGAGKTTTMRMMTGYLPPTEGRVLINDVDMFDHPMEVKKIIGYLPEHPPVYLAATVNEFL